MGVSDLDYKREINELLLLVVVLLVQELELIALRWYLWLLSNLSVLVSDEEDLGSCLNSFLGLLL